MNKLFSVFFLFPLFLSAQPKGFQLCKNPQTVTELLSKSSAGIETIASDFIQTKHMALLSENIKSKGRFYYKKEDKLRIEYTSPFSYLVVMNGGQMMIKDEQKTNRINTKNSKVMQSVNRIMIDCMKGTVQKNADFKVDTYENGSTYTLVMIPVTDAMKKMFKQIEVYINRKNFDVERLIMSEQGGDYTNMDFTNTQHNIALNESFFKAK